MRLTDNEYNVMYICHQTGIPLREAALWTPHEYEMWCCYFAKFNGVEKEYELTDEEVAQNNAKKFADSPLYNMIYKGDK